MSTPPPPPTLPIDLCTIFSESKRISHNQRSLTPLPIALSLLFLLLLVLPRLLSTTLPTVHQYSHHPNRPQHLHQPFSTTTPHHHHLHSPQHPLHHHFHLLYLRHSFHHSPRFPRLPWPRSVKL
ncbi:hypothetical protein PTKIN_Ptkin02bG0019100 [Pterospermum kingtungense]